MRRYVARRVVWAAFASLVILTITFLLMDVVPDQRLLSAEWQAAQAGADVEEAVAAEEARLGLDRPLHERYLAFLVNFFQGNWGWSHEYEGPVLETIIATAPYSMMYGVPALLISTVLGTAIGLYSAINQYTPSDYAATFVAFFGVSIPNWWFAIVLLVIFGTFLGWVDVGWNHYLAQSESGGLTWLETAGDDHPAFLGQEFEGERYVGVLSPANLKQLVLPVFVMTTGAMASVMRYARAEALEYVDAEFVKTARAKGVSARDVVTKHVFRPASVPLMTIFVGRILGLFLAGSYLIEVVFGIPGLGLASFRAIITQDHDLVMVTVLIPTFLVLIGNLIEDVTYAILDPRIEYGDRQ